MSNSEKLRKNIDLSVRGLAVLSMVLGSACSTENSETESMRNEINNLNTKVAQLSPRTETPTATPTQTATQTEREIELMKTIEKLNEEIAGNESKDKPSTNTKAKTPTTVFTKTQTATRTLTPVPSSTQLEKSELSVSVSNPRLSEPNAYKVPGNSPETWKTIIANSQSVDLDQNMFFLGLRTKPQKPADIGVPNSDPEKNQRLGHTQDVKYFVVEEILGKAGTTKVSDLITEDGELKMGGFIGDIQSATGMAAVITIAAENYETYKDKTIRELLADKKLVAKADVAQTGILDGKVELFGETKTNPKLRMPSVLKDGQYQFDTCEQYVEETATSKSSGKRRDGKINTRNTKHIEMGENTFTEAEISDEAFFVAFTTWGSVSGTAIATDRDYYLAAKQVPTAETQLWLDVQKVWASEEYLQLCLSRRDGKPGINSTPVPDVTPNSTATPFKTPPKETPRTPVRTPTPPESTPTRPASTRTPEATPTDPQPNLPTTAPTFTPEQPGQHPTDQTYPTVVPTQAEQPTQPAVMPTPNQEVPPTPQTP